MRKLYSYAYIQKALEGFAGAHADSFERVYDTNAVKLKNHRRNDIAVVLGGAAGIEPMLAAMLMEGTADAAVFGTGVSEPDPNSIMRTALSVGAGEGILFICDKLREKDSFMCAEGLLEEAHIDSELIAVGDDMASDISNGRGTTAGKLLIARIAKAVVSGGGSLKETYAIARKARNLTKSINMGISRSHSAQKITSLFESPESIEYGMGLNGEPGQRNLNAQSMTQIVDYVAFLLKGASGLRNGDSICTYLSGFGDIGLLDLYIFNNCLAESLKKQGIRIHGMQINPVPQESSGRGMTVTFMLLDDELERYYDAAQRVSG